MHIGILTGGGDAPGLNAVIRGITVRGRSQGHRITGFLRGWKGVIENTSIELNLDNVRDIHMQGGTVLLSSRTNPVRIENGFEGISSTYRNQELDCLIAIGGEDTLGVASQLNEQGLSVIGVPKTIDNDLSATDFTFGFDTAINNVMKTLDMLHTTAKSHERVIVVEIMGRHAGWMALYGGMAGGAHVILLPEVEFDTDEVCDLLVKRYDEGLRYAIVAIAEGAVDPQLQRHVMHSAAKDAFGHVQLGTGIGVGEVLKNEIADRTDLETRHVVLGHIQRGGCPSAFDRVLGTRLGVKAIEMAEKGQFGKMTALRGTEIEAVNLEDAVGTLKTVPLKQYETAKLFFG
ncbi:MAG: ATP-dependent 6-phosphofructokinase [Candidatus Aegiribacteria sp.]|nr:ATP-dependent 6-phosphofructokinase [Candidatus Aegiribacteria sp.]